MDNDLRNFMKHILTWVLYASAGFGALAYALFLRARHKLKTYQEVHGLVAPPSTFNPREALEHKLHGIEALRGLAIVTMLIGFLYWPVLFLGVLLFFFQTNAWKNAQHDLFALDRDHPEHKQAYQQRIDALGEAERRDRKNLERRGALWQRVFATTMGIALLVALSLLIVSVSWFSTVAPVAT